MGTKQAIERWSERTKTPDMTVVVGRFQTPYLHKGHRYLIETAIKKAKNTALIVIGTTGMNQTFKNPLNDKDRFLMVSEFIQSLSPKNNVVLVSGFKDMPFSNEKWSLELDNLIEKYMTTMPNSSTVELLGARDSFIESYSGKYSTTKLESIDSFSSTEIRNSIHSQSNFDGYDYSTAFRAGICFAHSSKKYPNIYPTVDVIIRRDNMILLGKKHGEFEWRLPGGFVDVDDESLEYAARREACEECGYEAELTTPKYLMSLPVKDRRYEGVKDMVFTTVFEINSLWGRHEAGDDLEIIEWVPIPNIREMLRDAPMHPKLLDGHKQILEAYVDK